MGIIGAMFSGILMANLHLLKRDADAGAIEEVAAAGGFEL